MVQPLKGVTEDGHHAVGKTWRVLVIDDDRDFAESVAEMLSLDGYQTLVALGRREALAAAATFAPHLCLVDIRLGTDSGLDLVPELRNTLPTSLFVVMTANSDVDSAISAVQRGAYDYVRKPFRTGELSAALDRAFEKLDFERRQREIEAESLRSQQWFANAIEVASEGLAFFDRDGRLSRCNRQFFTVFGITRKAAEGRTFEQVLRLLVETGSVVIGQDVADRDGWIARRVAWHLGKNSAAFELRTNHDRWVLVSQRRMEDGGTVVAFADISALKNRQAALAASERQLRLITDSVPALIAYFDKDLRFKFANAKHAEWFGLPLDKIVGARLHDLLTPQEFAETRKHIGKAFAGESAIWEGAVSFLGQRQRWVLAKYVPHFDESDGVEGVYALIEDISERNEAEEKIQRTERRLASLNQILIDAIEAIPGGFTIFGADDRLIVSNMRNSLAFPQISDCLKPGTPWIDIVRAAVERNVWAIEPDKRDAFIADRVADHGSAHETVRDVQTSDSRWFRIMETRTVEGGWLSLRLDITDQKRAEKELRDSESRLSGILGIAPEAVISIDKQQKIRIFNKGAEAIFGHAAADVIGKSIEILIPARMREGHAGHVEGFAAAPEQSRLMSRRGLISGLRADGTEFPAEGSISKLHTEDGEVFTVLLRDVTERTRIETALRDAKEEAELANRTKSEFLANMSHELRTPLNAILGFSEILKDELLGKLTDNNLRDTHIQYVRDIHGSGEHLLAIINDILDLSKIEAGHAQLHEEAVDIGALLGTCARLIRERAEKARLQFDLEIPAGLPRVWADERKLKQIALNLLSNAVKFTPQRGAITLSAARRAGEGVRIDVRDTGIGMTPEEVLVAMAPFAQIDSSLTRKHEGTGLGLPLSKRLIEMQGGALIVESEKGTGTVVTIALPEERVMSTPKPA